MGQPACATGRGTWHEWVQYPVAEAFGFERDPPVAIAAIGAPRRLQELEAVYKSPNYSFVIWDAGE